MKHISSYTVLAVFGLSFLCAIIALPAALQKTGTLKPEQFLNGQWTSKFEPNFTEAFPGYETVRVWWGQLDYALFKEGRKGVVIGKDNWLFTSEEFEHGRKSEENFEKHLNFTLKTAEQLKALNIPLVIALLPAKARVYQDKIKLPQNHQGNYDRILKSLQERSFLVVDLLPTLQADPATFLRTDTHWSPLGAKLAALKIADFVVQNCQGCIEFNQDFINLRTGEKDHAGDLLRYVPIGSMQADINKPDRLEMFELRSPVTSGAVDLFGDTQIPVTLIGTSYSANPDFHFAAFLKEALKSDVLNMADEGLGPFVTMQKWMESDEFKNQTPRLVVWEIPERYFTMKDMGLKK
jgi:alginate O-acetyltransferase complex protein AlgJ